LGGAKCGISCVLWLRSAERWQQRGKKAPRKKGKLPFRKVGKKKKREKSGSSLCKAKHPTKKKKTKQSGVKKHPQRIKKQLFLVRKCVKTQKMPRKTSKGRGQGFVKGVILGAGN